jgi:hypothetical protein
MKPGDLDRGFLGLANHREIYSEEELARTSLKVSRESLKTAFMYALVKNRFPHQGPAGWLSMIEAVRKFPQQLTDETEIKAATENYWTSQSTNEEFMLVQASLGKRVNLDNEDEELYEEGGFQRRGLPTIELFGFKLPVVFGYREQPLSFGFQATDSSGSGDSFVQSSLHVETAGSENTAEPEPERVHPKARSEHSQDLDKLQLRADLRHTELAVNSRQADTIFYPTSLAIVSRFAEMFPPLQSYELGAFGELPIYSPFAAKQQLVNHIEHVPSSPTWKSFTDSPKADRRQILRSIGVSRLLQALDIVIRSWATSDPRDGWRSMPKKSLDQAAKGWYYAVRPRGVEGDDVLNLGKLLEWKRTVGGGIDKSDGSIGLEWLRDKAPQEAEAHTWQRRKPLNIIREKWPLTVPKKPSKWAKKKPMRPIKKTPPPTKKTKSPTSKTGPRT